MRSITPRFNRTGQSHLWRPSVCDYSGIQGARADATFTSPYPDRLRLAEGSHLDIVALVVRLLSLSSPATVTRLVVAVIVAALNGVRFGRLSTHVRQKIPKVVPSLADLNSSPAVLGIEAGVRVSATTEHVRPSFIFRCLRSAAAIVSVPKIVAFSFEAPARSDMPSSKVAGNHRSFLSAITDAAPSELAGRSFPYLFDDSQPLKSESGEIFEFPIVGHVSILAGGVRAD